MVVRASSALWFAVSQSCALGGRVDYLEVPGADHRHILWKRSHVVMCWLVDPFAGAGGTHDLIGRAMTFIDVFH
ncbi:hypothetical protein HLY00_4094 [Mycolicibacterium hippocampi]|uniref:Uncharacterized protein n=1 Tax=Mycolicibacterium hippocampi TaxID=659824 RepID=A0A850PT13_9MYCO|nr:hypothetical protein [Mycolicibacterium hippocampi]